MTTTPTDATSWLALIETREQAAIAHLTQIAGNESLCTMSRGGTPRPSAKYHEGMVAALAQARRKVSKASDQNPSEALSVLRAEWDAKRGSGLASTPNWSAYLDGGVDALDEALDR